MKIKIINLCLGIFFSSTCLSKTIFEHSIKDIEISTDINQTTNLPLTQISDISPVKIPGSTTVVAQTVMSIPYSSRNLPNIYGDFSFGAMFFYDKAFGYSILDYEKWATKSLFRVNPMPSAFSFGDGSTQPKEGEYIGDWGNGVTIINNSVISNVSTLDTRTHQNCGQTMPPYNHSTNFNGERLSLGQPSMYAWEQRWLPGQNPSTGQGSGIPNGCMLRFSQKFVVQDYPNTAALLVDKDIYFNGYSLDFSNSLASHAYIKRVNIGRVKIATLKAIRSNINLSFDSANFVNLDANVGEPLIHSINLNIEPRNVSGRAFARVSVVGPSHSDKVSVLIYDKEVFKNDYTEIINIKHNTITKVPLKFTLTPKEKGQRTWNFKIMIRLP